MREAKFPAARSLRNHHSILVEEDVSVGGTKRFEGALRPRIHDDAGARGEHPEGFRKQAVRRRAEDGTPSKGFVKMTTKVAIISTVAILLGALLLGFLALYLFIDPRRGDANERAAMLGQGLAMLCLLPIGGVWIMWAARFRAERERKGRLRR